MKITLYTVYCDLMKATFACIISRTLLKYFINTVVLNNSDMMLLIKITLCKI